MPECLERFKKSAMNFFQSKKTAEAKKLIKFFMIFVFY